MPGVASAPMRITHCSAGSFAAFSAPGSLCASSGASVCSICRYIEVFSRSAVTMARQPDTLSAYSSSDSR